MSYQIHQIILLYILRDERYGVNIMHVFPLLDNYEFDFVYGKIIYFSEISALFSKKRLKYRNLANGSDTSQAHWWKRRTPPPAEYPVCKFSSLLIFVLSVDFSLCCLYSGPIALSLMAPSCRQGSDAAIKAELSAGMYRCGCRLQSSPGNRVYTAISQNSLRWWQK